VTCSRDRSNGPSGTGRCDSRGVETAHERRIRKVHRDESWKARKCWTGDGCFLSESTPLTSVTNHHATNPYTAHPQTPGPDLILHRIASYIAPVKSWSLAEQLQVQWRTRISPLDLRSASHRARSPFCLFCSRRHGPDPALSKFGLSVCLSIVNSVLARVDVSTHSLNTFFGS
jgi:hypothetical protein